MGRVRQPVLRWPRRWRNAIFDATGVRLRAVPFTAERVRAAFAG